MWIDLLARVGVRRLLGGLALLLVVATFEVGDALEVLGQLHDRGLRAGVLDQVRQPLVQAQTVEHDEVRIG